MELFTHFPMDNNKHGTRGRGDIKLWRVYLVQYAREHHIRTVCVGDLGQKDNMFTGYILFSSLLTCEVDNYRIGSGPWNRHFIVSEK